MSSPSRPDIPPVRDDGHAAVARRAAPFGALPSNLLVGGCVISAMIVVAIVAQWVTPFPYDEMHIRDRLNAPSLTYLLGTDELGRDVLSRTLAGAGLSLFLGVSATLMSLIAGVPLGITAGYYGGRLDEMIMRSLDVLISIPPILLALLLLSITEPGIWKTSFAVGILFVPAIARVARSVTLALVREDFIMAAHARGEGTLYIVAREILPNMWPPIIVEGSIRVTFAILVAAALSFLGFGVQPPEADWGLMISEGRAFIHSAPWITLAPGGAMCITVLAVNLLGDGLREVLDPRIVSQGVD